jgi:hypothetical protein
MNNHLVDFNGLDREVNLPIQTGINRVQKRLFKGLIPTGNFFTFGS